MNVSLNNLQNIIIEKRNIILLIVFSIILNIILGIIIQDFAFTFFNICIIILSCLYYFIIKNEKIFYLFLIFFNIYTFISICIYLSRIYQHNSFYAFPDETTFFASSFAYIENISIPFWANTSILDIIDQVDWKGYVYIIASLGWFFDALFENSFLALKQSSVVFGALSVVYVYKLIFYFIPNNNKAFIGASIFGLLPYMILYSSVLLRDIVIVFFTLFIFVQLLYFLSGKKLALIFSLIGIYFLYMLRLENGLFMLGILAFFVIYHLWKKINIYNKFLFFITLLIFIILFIDLIYLETIVRASNVLTKYSFKAIDGADDSSLGSQLFKLPFPFDIFSRMLLSQITPFPIWYHVQGNFYRVIDMFGGIIWFCIFLLSFFTFILTNFRKKLSRELIFLYLFALLYIFLVSNGDSNPRRLFMFYPIIYIVAMIGFDKLSYKMKKYYFISYISFAVVLHIVYLFIKY